MKKLIRRLGRVHQELEDIRNSLQEKVNALPDNPRLTRINDNCFTINSINSNWDVRFNSFKMQYKEIANIIQCSSDIVSSLAKITETGGYDGKVYKFHPDVVRNLKGAINGRKNMRGKA